MHHTGTRLHEFQCRFDCAVTTGVNYANAPDNGDICRLPCVLYDRAAFGKR